MNKKKISYKDEALSFLSRGEWKRALESFQKHLEQDPGDLRSRIKKAELLERLGNKKEAVEEYRQVAETYAKDGFLLQAISLNKIILRIDPSSKDIDERLTQLYMEKIRGSKPSQPLPHIPLLSDLKEEELRSLLGRVQFRTYPEGALLCREGEPGDSLVVIVRGEVSVYKQGPKGNEVWIQNLGEGESFGEFGFFLDRKRHATVKSIGESETLEITRNELQEIIKKYPRVNEVLEALFKKRVLDILLALSPLFAPLSVQEREEVLKRFHLHHFPADTFIFRRGEPPNSLYLIKSGEVEIFGENLQGKQVVLGRLRSGNLFGEIGVLLNTPRIGSARATQPSEILELYKKDFDELIQKFPNLQAIAKEISSKRLVRMKEIFSKDSVDQAKEPMV